ncbi:hypothetical protein WAF17_12130 [Bernardetia sp. ABR2-2B]|uniref:hypothetical protein n=1 Tax=Bernardetia sp. ABR2-2B TaxID=3127472 RepID=UPI0030CD79A4
MKYFVIIGLLFLSSCCIVTSQDCFCNSPDYKVSQNAFEWIIPYEDKKFFIFEDESGNIDSLKVERISETQICGGDECLGSCETEMVSLLSTKNDEIKFNLYASRSSYVDINVYYPEDKYLSGSFNVDNNDIYASSMKIGVNRNTDYINIFYKNSLNYFGYPIKGFIFTKQEGLIEYTTADNMKWTKVN